MFWMMIRCNSYNSDLNSLIDQNHVDSIKSNSVRDMQIAFANAFNCLFYSASMQFSDLKK